MPACFVRLSLNAALLCTPVLAAGDTVLRLGSDDWCPYICTSEGRIKDGYLVEVVARALPGHKVEAVLLPLNRAIQETLDGRLQGVYAPPIDQRLLLSAPVAYSRACFYTRADDSWTYQGIASLERNTVGIIKDYGYDEGVMDAYVAQYQSDPGRIELAYGDKAGISNLQKLLHGRYQIMLEHQAVLVYLSKKLRVSQQIRNAGCLEQRLPLSIGFSSQDPRSAAWIHALNEGVQRLAASGQLQALRLRYAFVQATP